MFNVGTYNYYFYSTSDKSLFLPKNDVTTINTKCISVKETSADTLLDRLQRYRRAPNSTGTQNLTYSVKTLG